MAEQIPARPVTTRQIVGVLAATLALFFIVAFASKSLEAYRLRLWRDRLDQEIQEMVRERDELIAMLERSKSTDYAEEILRQGGWVAPGSVGVVLVTATPEGPARPSPQLATQSALPQIMPSGATPAPASPPPSVAQPLFQNPTWEAWRRLIWGN